MGIQPEAFEVGEALYLQFLVIWNHHRRLRKELVCSGCVQLRVLDGALRLVLDNERYPWVKPNQLTHDMIPELDHTTLSQWFLYCAPTVEPEIQPSGRCKDTGRLCELKWHDQYQRTRRIARAQSWMLPPEELFRRPA